LDTPCGARAATGAPQPHRLARRLDASAVRAIGEAYGAGASAAELAQQHGLSRNGVLATLRKQGAVIRHPRLTPEDCATIIELYRSGQSQVEIARRFGREPSNIWHVLERAGLKGKH
jgi:transposase-like protein